MNGLGFWASNGLINLGNDMANLLDEVRSIEADPVKDPQTKVDNIWAMFNLQFGRIPVVFSATVRLGHDHGQDTSPSQRHRSQVPKKAVCFQSAIRFFYPQ